MVEQSEFLDDPLGESRPWPIKIHTLGRFEVYLANRPLRFARKVQRRPLSLLKAILAFGGQTVSEARLIETLWPDARDELKRFSLNSTVYRLRRLLGEREVLIRQDNCISLDARQVWVDAWVVERLLARAEQYVSNEGFDAMACCVATAVELYRGRFLDNDPSAKWAQPYADSLQRRLGSELFLVGRQLEINGRLDDAIKYYEQCLHIDACAEEVGRQLMALYHRAGQPAKALQVYNRCHTAITRQLGVPPSPQTQALLKEMTAS